MHVSKFGSKYVKLPLAHTNTFTSHEHTCAHTHRHTHKTHTHTQYTRRGIARV